MIKEERTAGMRTSISPASDEEKESMKFGPFGSGDMGDHTYPVLQTHPKR